MIVAGSGHVHMVVASQTASLEPRIVSMLYFADRLFQLPLGFVASAIGVVLLPHVSRGFQHGDREGMAIAQTESVIFASLLIFPATAGLWVLAEPIVAILFRHGAFLAEDAYHTARILRVLVLALPAFVLIKVALPAFLAREEVGRPLLIAAFALAINGVLALVLHGHDPVIAPAWGVVAGVWTNALISSASGPAAYRVPAPGLVPRSRCLACGDADGARHSCPAGMVGTGRGARARFRAADHDAGRPLPCRHGALCRAAAVFASIRRQPSDSGALHAESGLSSPGRIDRARTQTRSRTLPCR